MRRSIPPPSTHLVCSRLPATTCCSRPPLHHPIQPVPVARIARRTPASLSQNTIEVSSCLRRTLPASLPDIHTLLRLCAHPPFGVTAAGRHYQFLHHADSFYLTDPPRRGLKRSRTPDLYDSPQPGDDGMSGGSCVARRCTARRGAPSRCAVCADPRNWLQLRFRVTFLIVLLRCPQTESHRKTNNRGKSLTMFCVL